MTERGGQSDHDRERMCLISLKTYAQNEANICNYRVYPSTNYGVKSKDTNHNTFSSIASETM